MNLREAADGRSCHTSTMKQNLCLLLRSACLHTYSRYSHFSAHVPAFHSSCLSKNIIFQAHLRASCLKAGCKRNTVVWKSYLRPHVAHGCCIKLQCWKHTQCTTYKKYIYISAFNSLVWTRSGMFTPTMWCLRCSCSHTHRQHRCSLCMTAEKTAVTYTHSYSHNAYIA